MPWPIPSARTLAERLAASAELAIALVRPDIDPTAISRAVRSARGTLAIMFRAMAQELREVQDHIAWWGRMYMPDTAEDEFVLRHASIWGVQRRSATQAVGTLLVEGVAGTVLPLGLLLSTSDGTAVATTAVATIGVGGTINVVVQASVAGVGGNVEAGARLTTTAPFPAVTRATVVAPGMAGGNDEQSPDDLRAATLDRIRQPPHGGAGFDYPSWLAAAFPAAAVRVVTDWVGRGSVGVIVAMRDGAGARVPTGGELTAMLAYLGAPGSSTGVRPVTAFVAVVPVTLQAVPITVRLRPDTVATRAAVTDAFVRFVATIGDDDDASNVSPIGAVIEPSRISEAISAATGEYAHDLIVPNARYTLPTTAYPAVGAITFAAPL